MIAKFFKRKSASNPIDTAQLPDGVRIYAVGDIHGRNDLLIELLDRIEADDQARGGADTQIILLGDLVDRGPSSAQVVETCIDLKAKKPATRFLMGNHEEIFIQACRQPNPELLRFLIRIGGEATIMSYPISRSDYLDLDIQELVDRLPRLVPEHHLAFLESFEDEIIVGDYAFVHAGVKPGRPLADQSPKDLRWIREEFLNHKGDFEKVIVYGHTITTDVDEGRSRIGIDTGAYDSGKLTAIGLQSGQRWYLQT